VSFVAEKRSHPAIVKKREDKQSAKKMCMEVRNMSRKIVIALCKAGRIP
jgi:hypothetical protein